jgi:hypothetical protein
MWAWCVGSTHLHIAAVHNTTLALESALDESTDVHTHILLGGLAWDHLKVEVAPVSRGGEDKCALGVRGCAMFSTREHRDTAEVELTVGIKHWASKLQGLVDVPAD